MLSLRKLEAAFERGDTLNTNRAEAFSDGVFAIAATLLVLELKVPHVEPGGLSEALLERWPSYATYVVSFLTIGIIWVNHHAVMERIKNVNRPLLFSPIEGRLAARSSTLLRSTQSRGRTMNHSTNSAHRFSSSKRNVHRFQKNSPFV